GNSCRRDGRMIDQREKHAIGKIFESAQSGLERGEHALGVTRILGGEHGRRGEAHQVFRVSAEDRADGRAVPAQSFGENGEERSAAERQERFGLPHAARFSGSQDDGGNAHFSMARECSSVKMDFEIPCQLPSGTLRTAIISAATEMAISSGVTAPISSPMGAETFSNAARGIPSFSSSLTTEMVLRLLPIMAM